MRLVFLVASLLIAVCAHAEQPEIRPGLWQFTMEGVPFGPKICITPEMAKDMKSVAQKPDPDSDCKMTDETVTGATRTFKISCTKPEKFDGTVSQTVNGPDNFTMTTEYSGGQEGSGSMTMNYNRVGDCP